MGKELLIQFFTLSLYTFFMGFTFCDGFRLYTGRKLIWFAVFLAICIYVLKAKGNFDLSLILPVPTLLAVLLCAFEKRKEKRKIKKEGA